jgi:hypothetical protein
MRAVSDLPRGVGAVRHFGTPENVGHAHFAGTPEELPGRRKA